MRATILKIDEYQTKDGGAIAVFFKSESGASYRSWIVKKFRNYERWKDKLEVGNILENLTIKKGLVDADSRPVYVGRDYAS